MKFTLTIEMGNEAMRSPQDVEDVLKRVADHVGWRLRLFPTSENPIRDRNGNSIGSWEVTE